MFFLSLGRNVTKTAEPIFIKSSMRWQIGCNKDVSFWFLDSYWKREIQKGCFGPSFKKCKMAAKRNYLQKKESCMF